MKKFSILIFSMMLAVAFISCSSGQKQDTAGTSDKKVEAKADPKADCKAACEKTANDCVAKAGKVKAKLNKCEADKKTCVANCDKPAKEAAKTPAKAPAKKK